MKLYIKQKIFAIGDKFNICDEAGNPRYFVKEKLISFGKQFRVNDMQGNELLFIKQKLFRFFPTFRFFKNGNEIACIKKKFSFFRDKFLIPELGWEVQGNFLDHQYGAKDANGNVVLAVRKKWLSWSDTYEIEFSDSIDPAFAIAVVIVIDACLAMRNDASSHRD